MTFIKNTLSTIFLFFICKISFSQKKITVLDSLTKEPIPFHTLKYNNEVMYSDKNGDVILPYFKDSDSLFFTSLNFYDKKVAINKIDDAVYLIPNETVLDELSINILEQPITINTKSKKDSSSPIKPKDEVLIQTVFNEDFYGYHIKKISTTINRDFITYNKNKATKDYEIYIRINFYNKDLKIIDSTEPIIFTQKKKNILEIDLMNKIEITSEPIYIALEFIGVVDKEGKFLNSEFFYLRPLYFLNNLQEVKSQIYTKNAKSNSLTPTYKQLDWMFKHSNDKKKNDLNEYDIHFFSFEIQ